MSGFLPSVKFDDLQPMTTKGDLIVETSAGSTRLPIAADNTVLTADSTAGAGVSWKTVSSATALNVATLTGATTLTTSNDIVLASGFTDYCHRCGHTHLG